MPGGVGESAGAAAGRMPQSSLPDRTYYIDGEIISVESQCTYRCVVLPDRPHPHASARTSGLNAPTGAWCSLTAHVWVWRCISTGLNAPTGAWCSLTAHVWVWRCISTGLNAPTGAWCSLTRHSFWPRPRPSGCLNAPTGAWCSLTIVAPWATITAFECLNAPTGAWCSLTIVAPWATITAFECLNAPTGAWCSLTPALGSGGMTPLRGPGAPPAPGAPLRTGQHRAQSSTYWRNHAKRHRRPSEPSARQLSTRSCGKVGVGGPYSKRVT